MYSNRHLTNLYDRPADGDGNSYHIAKNSIDIMTRVEITMIVRFLFDNLKYCFAFSKLVGEGLGAPHFGQVKASIATMDWQTLQGSMD